MATTVQYTRSCSSNMTFQWLVIILAGSVYSQSPSLGPYSPPPSIVISPADNPLQKPAGQPISLLCSVENLPSDFKPGLIWTKNGGLFSAEYIKVVRLDAGTMSLNIKNATAKDSGVYTCQAQLQNGTRLQRTVDVVVFEDYHFVDKTTSTGAVMATAAVNISCQVHPSRDTFVTLWTRPSQPTWAPGPKHRLYNGGAILEITNYDPKSDAGDYNCKVNDATTGVSLVRKIVVGSEQENKRMFCTNMCTNVCHQLYQSPVF